MQAVWVVIMRNLLHLTRTTSFFIFLETFKIYTVLRSLSPFSHTISLPKSQIYKEVGNLSLLLLRNAFYWISYTMQHCKNLFLTDSKIKVTEMHTTTGTRTDLPVIMCLLLLSINLFISKTWTFKRKWVETYVSFPLEQQVYKLCTFICGHWDLLIMDFLELFIQQWEK